VENCKRYGAHVVIHGADIGESRHHALKLAKKYGFMYINGYDHPHILAGATAVYIILIFELDCVAKHLIKILEGSLCSNLTLSQTSIRFHI
jgi:threonine dehydratase